MTKRQSQLLAFLRQYIGANNFAPSYDEMMGALGLRSKCGIHRLLKALEFRGFIRRKEFRARAIELAPIRPPSCPHCGGILT